MEKHQYLRAKQQIGIHTKKCGAEGLGRFALIDNSWIITLVKVEGLPASKSLFVCTAHQVEAELISERHAWHLPPRFQTTTFELYPQSLSGYFGGQPSVGASSGTLMLKFTLRMRERSSSAFLQV